MQDNVVKVLPVSHSSALDKLLDYMPDIVEKANNLLANKCLQNKKSNPTKDIDIIYEQQT